MRANLTLLYAKITIYNVSLQLADLKIDVKMLSNFATSDPQNGVFPTKPVAGELRHPTNGK